MKTKQKLPERVRLKQQLDILNEIAKTLTSSLTINEVLSKIFTKMVEVFNPENWSLLLVDEKRNELYFEIAVGEAAKSIKDIRLKIGEGIAGWVAQTGEPVIVPNVKDDPHFTDKVDQLSDFATRSVICIPLKIRDKVMGVIELVNRETTLPHDHFQLEALISIADFAAIALENARQFEEISRLTITDDLTGLYNSRHMHSILQKQYQYCLEHSEKFSVIFFDLDFFKQINDVYGHLLGSQLLRAVGKLVRTTLPKHYHATRYGGDEFVLILPNTNRQQAITFCRKLRKTLITKKFFKQEGHNIQLTASFGISTFPDDGADIAEILHAADKRMYSVKSKNRNDIAF